jgi:hypothetical protein
VVLDKRQKAGFIGYKNFNSGLLPWPRHDLTQRPHTPPPPSPPQQDDSKNFVASVFHAIHMAQQEGRQIELPEELTEDVATRLGILISEML